MAYDQERLLILYKKLVSLYPGEFRERLGESMEQTFNDLCRERKEKKAHGFFGFALWLFFETALGVGKEYVLLLKQRGPMKTIIKDFGSAALISLLVVIPLMILEWVNRRNSNESFPIPLFILMWLLPVIFIVILVSIVRTMRAGQSITANPISLLSRVALLALLATVWGWGLIDQLPCFLGVPNCD